MSSYRPPSYRRNIWPNREAEKRDAARKAEEEQKRRMEMTDMNFPNLSTARPLHQRDAPDGNQFAKLAHQWAVDDEVDRRMTDYKNFQEAVDKREIERVALRRTRIRHARHEAEQDAEDLAPLPQLPQPVTTGIEDDVGWTEVKRKSYKTKRELTVDEMDERERVRQEEERREDDFNGHLFESNRHDHDRV